MMFRLCATTRNAKVTSVTFSIGKFEYEKINVECLIVDNNHIFYEIN